MPRPMIRGGISRRSGIRAKARANQGMLKPGCFLRFERRGNDPHLEMRLKSLNDGHRPVLLELYCAKVVGCHAAIEQGPSEVRGHNRVLNRVVDSQAADGRHCMDGWPAPMRHTKAGLPTRSFAATPSLSAPRLRGGVFEASISHSHGRLIKPGFRCCRLFRRGAS
jgi:hypothetical protein